MMNGSSELTGGCDDGPGVHGRLVGTVFWYRRIADDSARTGLGCGSGKQPRDDVSKLGAIVFFVM